MLRRPYWIDPAAPPTAFPPVDRALREPNGLLAAGGDLSPARLLNAYRAGIFPWYSEGQPILWWSPDPRAVLFPNDLKISRSLRKTIRRREFHVTTDTVFRRVVAGCAAPRGDDSGTWITEAMSEAYCRLHSLGYAHSVECWQGSELVGGLYGVALGRVFFGESMFSRVSDASKVALVYLRDLHFELIDCQIPNDHLSRLGARGLGRRDFVALLERWCGETGAGGFKNAAEVSA